MEEKYIIQDVQNKQYYCQWMYGSGFSSDFEEAKFFDNEKRAIGIILDDHDENFQSGRTLQIIKIWI